VAFQVRFLRSCAELKFKPFPLFFSDVVECIVRDLFEGGINPDFVTLDHTRPQKLRFSSVQSHIFLGQLGKLTIFFPPSRRWR